jgi:hypothetical protein
MQKVDDISGSVLFEETVGLPQWITMLLMVSGAFVVLLTGVLGFAVQEDKSEPLIALLIVVPLQLVIILFYRRMKLEKVVTSNGLYYRWKALHKKYRYIDRSDLQELEVKKGPSLKYGPGWMFGYGRFHSVNDKKGLQLYLAGKKRMFFGTENIDEFHKVMNQLLPRK